MRVFKEQQRFTQLWLIVLIIISCIIPFIVLIREYQKDKMSNQELIISLFLISLASGVLFLFQLKTRIDEKGIHYQFFPFHFSFKLITWQEIEKAHLRTYDPIGEYGGWGLKGGALWNKSKGKAINVSGDIGIQLELKSGKKLLIGTQKETQANQVLQKYLKN